ncbi:hypothetical protein [Arthrobacter sp. ISL-72]|uniref:hypothetical protein n=1 Tax=Arthrobacter sp. ISL-72 TaxID=2819114 RepID=UPI001BEC21D1|nr:hypothetical protein [Arthrobacter sp. ISL-72]MBT2598116.1 hypothetical protein [Arthrobacter sp. ISL-72]
MRAAKTTAQTDQARHLSENLRTQLIKGREWATPGVEAALQRTVAGLDTGIESASPRIQAALRRIADELAGGVETLTPRVQERLKGVAPKAAPVITGPGPAATGRTASRKVWLIAGMLAVAVSGAAAWRSFRTPDKEPVSPATAPAPNDGDPDAGPAAAAAQS